MAGEKVCCEFRSADGFEWRCVETDDGYQIHIKGDKEKLRKSMTCCPVPGHMGFMCAPAPRQGGSCCG